ncbi:MAG: transposase, partial [Spirochaetia bacterium]|nr:transposase [Spirochaetia bacterium]
IITSLGVLDFIQKFLLHVLPSGFMKVRYYGFMHSSFSMDYGKLRLIVEGFNSVMNKAAREVPEKVLMYCSSCGESMKFMFSILPNNARIRGSGFT